MLDDLSPAGRFWLAYFSLLAAAALCWGLH
jgi:hypothetical protein